MKFRPDEDVVIPVWAFVLALLVVGFVGAAIGRGTF